jgi:hypothetical protein
MKHDRPSGDNDAVWIDFPQDGAVTSILDHLSAIVTYDVRIDPAGTPSHANHGVPSFLDNPCAVRELSERSYQDAIVGLRDRTTGRRLDPKTFFSAVTVHTVAGRPCGTRATVVARDRSFTRCAEAGSIPRW